MTSSDSAIDRAAQTLSRHRLARARFQLLGDDIRPRDQRAAYRVQDRLHEVLAQSRLGPIAGHKIGCTTPVMQRFLGIDSPCAGGVFGGTVQHHHASVRFADYLHVGIECEIVIWLGRDLPAGNAPFDAAGVAPAVAAVAPGIEIVDDRYENYKSMDTPTLIADDFFNAGAVIGAPIDHWQAHDLGGLGGRTLINDIEVGRGHAADVMGHPFEALAWLANCLAARGQFLRRGQFVFTGSIVETRWVAPGDRVRIEIDRLGAAGVEFTV